MTSATIVAKKKGRCSVIRVAYTGFDFMERFLPQERVDWEEDPGLFLSRYLDWRHRKYQGPGVAETPEIIAGERYLCEWYPLIRRCADWKDFQLVVMEGMEAHPYSMDSDWKIVVDFDLKLIFNFDIPKIKLKNKKKSYGKQ